MTENENILDWVKRAMNENILDWVKRAIRAETTINNLSSILQETYPDVGLMRRILMVDVKQEDE